MLKINIISGDITQTTEVVDAIATLVNSGGMWFGGVDGAIKRKYGNWYHSRLATQIDYPKDGVQASDGKIYIVEGEKNRNHSFKDVIFIIDDLNLPLSTLVFNALEAAEKAGYKRIAMPSMRNGVMAGIVEKNIQEVSEAMKQGVLSFKEKYPNSALVVDIVIFYDPEAEKFYKQYLI